MEAFWARRLRGIREEQGYRAALDDLLDRSEVVREHACFSAASDLLIQTIVLRIAGADQQAGACSAAARFYFEKALETDDIGLHRRLGQEELGASRRIRGLCLCRWIESPETGLDLEMFAEAVRRKESWNRAVFARKDWRKKGYNLAEWMAEKIIVGVPQEALEIADGYHGREAPPRGHRGGPSAEATVSMVAEFLSDPAVSGARRAAAERMDDLYESFTDWGPDFDEHAVPYDLKLLYAYVRGRHFKGVEDPIRLIKMMKFSE
jgi:hypothetical protein